LLAPHLSASDLGDVTQVGNLCVNFSLDRGSIRPD